MNRLGNYSNPDREYRSRGNDTCKGMPTTMNYFQRTPKLDW